MHLVLLIFFSVLHFICHVIFNILNIVKPLDKKDGKFLTHSNRLKKDVRKMLLLGVL